MEQAESGTFCVVGEPGKIVNLISKKIPAQREKCPNTELFLVRIFPYSN